MGHIWFVLPVILIEVAEPRIRVQKTIPIFISCHQVPIRRLFLGYRKFDEALVQKGAKYMINRCNQQIAAASLLFKGPDVTRSTVQKAVVVLASKPVFGPIRYD